MILITSEDMDLKMFFCAMTGSDPDYFESYTLYDKETREVKYRVEFVGAAEPFYGNGDQVVVSEKATHEVVDNFELAESLERSVKLCTCPPLTKVEE